MPMLEYAAPWDRQPQEWTSIAQSRLCEGLAVLAVPSIAYEYVGGGLPTVSGGYSFGVGSLGISADGPATQIPGYVGYDTPAADITTAAGVTFLVFASVSGTGSISIFTHSFEKSGSFGVTGFMLGANIVKSQIDNNPSPTVTTVSMVTPRVIVTKRDGGSNQVRLYIDGEYSGQAVTGTRTGSIIGATIGRDRVGGNNTSGVKTYLIAAWNRALLDAEIAGVSANPWQLFAPQIIPIPFSVGGPPPPSSLSQYYQHMIG